MSSENGWAMDVARIEHDGGSRIEPPFSESWDDLTKLEWHAGVARVETGLPISVKPGAITINDIPQDGWYSITIASSSHSAFTYDQAWIYMSGIITGHKSTIAKQSRDEGKTHDEGR